MSPIWKYLLRNLGTRPFISALVLGAMLVVGATIGGVAAIGSGLLEAFSAGGHDNWAMVVAARSQAEKDSKLPLESLGPITITPGVKRYSVEAVHISMVATSDNVEVIQLRALEPQGFEMRDMKLLEGRMPRSGEKEIIVGSALLAHWPWLGIGSTITLVSMKFTCVGIFQASGFQSGEVWTTRAAIQSNPVLSGLSVIYLETASAADALATSASLTGNRALKVTAVPESAFYNRMMRDFRHLIDGMAMIFLLVVTGAVLAAAALLSIFQQRRLSELCVMRAMGFRSRSIAMLILYETELLVMLGGAAGVGLSALGLRHYVVTATTPTLATIAYAAPLKPTMAALSLVIVFLIGIVGAIVPIVRMVRTPITRGLREE